MTSWNHSWLFLSMLTGEQYLGGKEKTLRYLSTDGRA
jgi:hypothetical protein